MVRLGEMLVLCGAIEKVQLWEALNRQEKSHRPLGRILIEMGAITEEELSDMLKYQLASYSI